MLKILQVVAYYAPAWGYGGPPRVMHEMAKALVKRGHEVTVYTTDAHDRDSRVKSGAANLDSIDVIYHRNISNSLAWNSKKFFPPGFVFSIMKNTGKFDIIHIAEVRTTLNLMAAYRARRRNVPYVISPYGAIPGGSGGIKTFFKKWFDPLFTRPLLLGARRVYVQTEHEGYVAAEFGVSADRIELVPLGINLEEFSELDALKGTFRRKFEISESEKVILFLGRIHEYKGIQLLVRAFEKIAPEFRDARLVIAGRDDGYLGAIQELVRNLGLTDRTVFTGPLFGNERIAAYLDADVFAITPYHFEETSLAALEACACSTPVVVTGQCSFPWLEEYAGGYIIKYDMDELVSSLVKILADNELRKRMGASARKMIEEKFDWTKIAGLVEASYLKVLSGH